MPDPPLVSVIIPSYNASVYLADAIDSALNQTLPPAEVIIIDDGSTDETSEVLKQYKRSIQYVFQENRGVAAARNRGISAALGKYVAFLDADDVWFPEKLQRQFECLEEHPQAALIHSDVVYWNPSNGEKYRQDKGRRAFAGSCYHRLWAHNRILPSTTVALRECFTWVGGFDERLRRAEDYDMWFRIARHYECAYVDEPLMFYRLHAQSLTRNTLAMLESELFVVQKALKADPELARTIGDHAVRERLFTLLFNIGYEHHNAHRHHEARRYFVQALRHHPGHAYTWLLYLANQLPSQWVQRLRKSKEIIGSPLRGKWAMKDR